MLTLSFEGISDNTDGVLITHIQDMGILTIDGITYLYTYTNGAPIVSTFMLTEGELPHFVDSLSLPAGLASPGVTDGVVLEQSNGASLFLGSEADGEVFGVEIGNNGSLSGSFSNTASGASTSDAKIISELSTSTNSYILMADQNNEKMQLFKIKSDDSTVAFGSSIDVSDNDVLVGSTITVAGQQYILVGSYQDSELSSYKVDEDARSLVKVDSSGFDLNIGISGITDLESVQINGNSYVIVASGNSNSLTVFSIDEHGNLLVEDHVLASLNAGFVNVSEIDTFEVNGQTFILATGSNNALCLLTILPSGQLVHLQTSFASANMPTSDISNIETWVNGSEVQVFVSSETAPGVISFSLSLSDFGDVVYDGNADGHLSGSALNDTLDGGKGDDTISAGAGNDLLIDGQGSDTLTGGAGADTFILTHDNATDVITDFEVGVDRIEFTDQPGLYTSDQITVQTTSNGALITVSGDTTEVFSADGYGLDKDDLFEFDLGPIQRPPNRSREPIDGSTGQDQIWGNLNDQLITTSGGDDIVFAMQGYDELSLGNGADIGFAGSESDTIYSGSGDDIVFGEDGNDVFNASGNGADDNDQYFGGAGDDIISAKGATSRISGGQGNDTVNGSSGSDLLRGGDGKDTLTGNDGKDWMNGGTASDHMVGGKGNDQLFGGSGNDQILGGNGHDIVHGGIGDDTIWLDAGNDQFIDTLDSGNDTVFGGGGNDKIISVNGHDVLNGGGGNDTIYGGDGQNTIDGGSGADRIFAGTGKDVVKGGKGSDFVDLGDQNDIYEDHKQIGKNGADTVNGGTGDDVFNLRGGNDILCGGEGVDKFVFGNAKGDFTITDFNKKEDVLEFASDVELSFTANPAGLLIEFGNNSVLLLGLEASDISGLDIQI